MSDREPVNIMGVIAFPEPDKSKRRIRFIDPEYNTLFYIPDGASTRQYPAAAGHSGAADGRDHPGHP